MKNFRLISLHIGADLCSHVIDLLPHVAARDFAAVAFQFRSQRRSVNFSSANQQIPFAEDCRATHWCIPNF